MRFSLSEGYRGFSLATDVRATKLQRQDARVPRWPCLANHQVTRGIGHERTAPCPQMDGGAYSHMMSGPHDVCACCTAWIANGLPLHPCRPAVSSSLCATIVLGAWRGRRAQGMSGSGQQRWSDAAAYRGPRVPHTRWAVLQKGHTFCSTFWEVRFPTCFPL